MNLNQGRYFLNKYKFLNKHNVRLQPSKFQFLRREVVYLGHFNITDKGVEPDSEKYDVVHLNEATEPLENTFNIRYMSTSKTAIHTSCIQCLCITHRYKTLRINNRMSFYAKTLLVPTILTKASETRYNYQKYIKILLNLS